MVPSSSERAFWVGLSSFWEGWREVLQLVRPDTVVRWHRRGFRWFWTWKSRGGGRPRVDKAIRVLVERFARENPVWGAPRVHGELVRLGYTVSQRTVSRLMPRPERHRRRSTWCTFVRNHLGDFVAIDFFVITTATFDLLYGFLVLSLGRRRIMHTAVTAHPTATWTAQQVSEALANETPRRLIRDRDGIYGRAFSARLDAMHVAELVTAPRSPQQNAYAERVIGSVRRECLDHVVVLGERHAQRLLADYAVYYNGSRTHLALAKDAPEPRPIDLPENGPMIESVRYVGGLHHRYSRRPA